MYQQIYDLPIKRVHVYGNSWVDASAKVYGNAEIYGEAIVTNKACVGGDAKVSNFMYGQDYLVWWHKYKDVLLKIWELNYGGIDVKSQNIFE